MTPTPTELVVEAVRAVLAAELDLAQEIVPVTTPEESGALAGPFLSAVGSHRVAHLLAPHAEVLGLSTTIRESLAAQVRQSTLAAMATVAAALRVSTTLDAQGIPHLMIKGVALAVQTTGSPVARGTGDVDVLIDPARVRDAVEALQGAGYRLNREIFPPLDSPLFPPMQRSHQELTLLGDGTEVDLHWRLDESRACLSWEFDELAEAAEWFTLGRVSFPTLSRVHATVLNSNHGARDSWSHLRALVDQARLQRTLDEDSLRVEAWRVGSGRRWELAQSMMARLLRDRPPPEPRTTRYMAIAMWTWILAGEAPRDRRDARANARGFAASILTLDSSRAAAQRIQTVVWPTAAMADRSLGDTGDRHPWLYAAATPYLLPKRLLEKWR